MENKVKILSDSLINQIAAGEVVERPASVIKELIENSIDAGATRIRVEFESAGRKLIRVIDDGEGMTRDDALLALERHATSKIQSSRDLFSISSMGFRGEALPSIAAISRLELVTRTRDMESAVKIYAEAGKIKEVSDIGGPFGTTVDVKNLFYNVPARRKFLKKPGTEAGHVSDTVSRIALGRPDVHFELVHGGKNIFSAPANQKILDRIRETLGASVLSELLPIEKTMQGLLPEGPLPIKGYISRPSFTRSSSRSLYIFVNRRFVKDRIINHAVLEAYRTLMPKGRYPLIVLFLDLPAETVDVNVHPAKSEVRFREPVTVHQAVLDAIINVLKKDDRTGREYRPPRIKDSEHQQRVQAAIDRYSRRHDSINQDISRPSIPREFSGKPSGSTPPLVPEPLSAGMPEQRFMSELSPGYFSNLRVLGQIKEMYIVCEAEDEMVMIDQHAAAERVAFERLKREYISRDIKRQALLFPQTFELGYRDAAILESNIDKFENLGLEIEPFGQNAFILKSLPGILADADISGLVMDLIEEIGSLGRTVPLEEKLDDIFSVMSCHAVIRGPRRMTVEEMKELLKSLDEIEFPSHCPHGRPVVNRISVRDIEKMFGR